MKKLILTLSMALFMMSCSNMDNSGCHERYERYMKEQDTKDSIATLERNYRDTLIKYTYNKEYVADSGVQIQVYGKITHKVVLKNVINRKYKKIIDRYKCDQAYCIVNNIFYIGYSKEMVIASVGEPKKIIKIQHGDYKEERWIYDYYMCLYFDNSKLYAMQIL